MDDPFRSSRPEIFIKKVILKNFAEIQKKFFCLEVFHINKVVGC